MKEINYQIFDEVSGLPFETLTDKFVKKIAFESKLPVSEVYKAIKEDVKNTKIKYFIKKDDIKIIPMPENSFKKTQGKYFSTYIEAKEFLNGIN